MERISSGGRELKVAMFWLWSGLEWNEDGFF